MLLSVSSIGTHLFPPCPFYLLRQSRQVDVQDRSSRSPRRSVPTSYRTALHIGCRRRTTNPHRDTQSWHAETLAPGLKLLGGCHSFGRVKSYNSGFTLVYASIGNPKSLGPLTFLSGALDSVYRTPITPYGIPSKERQYLRGF